MPKAPNNRFNEFDDFPFGIGIVRAKIPSFPIHVHDHDELLVVLSGSAQLMLGTRRIAVSRGDVYAAGANVPHGFDDFTDFEARVIFFDRERLASIGDDLASMPGYQSLFWVEPHARAEGRNMRLLKLAPDDLTRAIRMIEVMRGEDLSRHHGWRTAVYGGLASLIVHIARCCERRTTRDESRHYRSLAATAAYMARNPGEWMTLATLAKRAGLSVNHFLRTFGNIYGESPMEYLTRHRIDRAMALMAKFERSITDIAFECGFTDSNYFARLFKRATGQTPREFRKRIGR